MSGPYYGPMALIWARGLVSVPMSFEGHDMRVQMLVDSTYHGSYGLCSCVELQYHMPRVSLN